MTLWTISVHYTLIGEVERLVGQCKRSLVPAFGGLIYWRGARTKRSQLGMSERVAMYLRFPWQEGRGFWTAANSLAAYDVVRIVLGLVLLTAATLKGHQLATEPVAETSLFTSRWFLRVFAGTRSAYAAVGTVMRRTKGQPGRLER